VANKHVKLGRGPKKEIERALKLLTNEPTELKKSTLRIMYQACDFEELAYMDGRDPATGEIVPLLIGLQVEADGQYSIYPVARLYMGKDIPDFEPPDGRGSYIKRDSGDGAFHNDEVPNNDGTEPEGNEPLATPIGEFIQAESGTPEGLDEANVEAELGGHDDSALRRGSE